MIEITADLFNEMYNSLPDPKTCDTEMIMSPLLDKDGNIVEVRFIKENLYGWTPLKDIVIKGYLNKEEKPKRKFFPSWV